MTYSPVRLGATGVSRVLTNLSYGDLVTNAYNLVGGIATATSLRVSGITTLGADGGITTTRGSVWVGAGHTIYGPSAKFVMAEISDTLSVLTFQNENLLVTGVATFMNPIDYPVGKYQPKNGVAYFNQIGNVVSSGNTNSYTTTTNYLFTTNADGIPLWSAVLDGGEY